MANDTMKGLRRTHYCGEIPLVEGSEVVVCGFVDRVRDKKLLTRLFLKRLSHARANTFLWLRALLNSVKA